MNEHLEIEYKILITKEILLDLLKKYPDYKEYTQRNDYFLDESLSKRYYSLRIRTKNNQYEMTLKRPEGNARLETNINISKKEKTLLLNHQKINNEIVQILEDEGLDITSFDTSHYLQTHRYDIQLDEGILSLDISTYNGITDYELEYEVDDEKNGFERFLSIIHQYHLEYKGNCKSKTQRVLDTL